jgi:uncharacterized protein YlxW (UPF0749 family)
VDFLADNAVPIAAIIFGVLVLVTLGILAVAGLRLWGVIKSVQREVLRAGGALAAEAALLSESLERQPERRAELQEAIAALSQRVALLQSLASHASEAVAVLRSPLRYVGR